MTDEAKRRAIAEGIAATHINEGWVFSPDHSIPATAGMYAVYDGVDLLAAGYSISRVAGMVARCKMPIVFYQGAK